MSIRSAVRVLLASCVLAIPAGAEEPDPAAVAKGNNELAFDLYGRLRAKDGNLFFSPYSISSALAMTWAGAKGNTEAVMAKAMRFALPQDKIHAAFGARTTDLNGRVAKGRWNGDPDKGRKAMELVVANSLWAQKGYPFRKDYFERVTKAYGAGLTELDFVADTEGARKTINGWVEDRTNKKIQELLAKGMLTSNTCLVLTNAIYFKAGWAEPFEKAATKEADFHLTGGGTVKVPMMHQTADMGYVAGDGFDVVSMPYLEHQATLVAFVPKKADGFAAMEKTLSEVGVAELLGKLAETNIALGFPRFKTTSAFNLNDALKALGMKDAFDASTADFTGMTEKRELYIGLVIHKAFVDVNEEGTEAAAATAVVMEGKGAPDRPVELVIDRPFVFLIRDSKTGAILFMGRVLNPGS